MEKHVHQWLCKFVHPSEERETLHYIRTQNLYGSKLAYILNRRSVTIFHACMILDDQTILLHTNENNDYFFTNQQTEGRFPQLGGQVLARGKGDECGPCSTPSAITLYTASVGCVPSHEPYVDGSSHTVHPGLPHGTVWLPQHESRAFVIPAVTTYI